MTATTNAPLSEQRATPRASISAFVVCMNEEKNLPRCLESIAWCDEIVIVDSGSTDKTLEIARQYTSLIYHREWPGFVEQKRFGLTLCSKEWVLNVDADEVVTPELRKEIEDELAQPTIQYDGFQLLRVVFYLGKWFRRGGWYPEYRLRVCRRTTTSWGGMDPHERAMVVGPTKRLKGELQHYTYEDITHQIRTLNSYSSRIVQSLKNENKNFSPIQLIASPVFRFLKFYFLKRGFLDGLPGLIVAVNEAFYSFTKYAKLWEVQRNLDKKQ
jgi:glycosyltransferase involved in cell wall biosynthesis